MLETVTATAILTKTTNVILILSVNGEASNGPSPRAYDSVHLADHETGDALNVWESSRQTYRQHERSSNACSPPPAVPLPATGVADARGCSWALVARSRSHLFVNPMV
jgi:hypothetical protein